MQKRIVLIFTFIPKKRYNFKGRFLLTNETLSTEKLKNCSGIWVISEAVAVSRSISCFFCSVVSLSLSIDMSPIVPIYKVYALLICDRQVMTDAGRSLDVSSLFSASHVLTYGCLLM